MLRGIGLVMIGVKRLGDFHQAKASESCSAIEAPWLEGYPPGKGLECRSTLLPRLPLRTSEPVSATRLFLRLVALTGENIATGDPKLDDKDGGGTCGYVS